MNEGFYAGSPSMGEEPGSTDNRLTLRPGDFPVINDWKDGNTYSISELGPVKLRQIATGEFEIIKAADEGETESAGEEPGNTEQPSAQDAEESGYPNPAIARRLRS